MIEPEDLVFEPGSDLVPLGTRRRRGRNQPVDPVKSARGRRARRNGNAAALEWAKLVGGVNVGQYGAEDTRQAFMLWEVKSGPRPQLATLEKALDQVAPHAARRNLPFGVAWRLPDRPLSTRWLVVLRGPAWLELAPQPLI